MSELKLINECAPIDLELCALLGEEPKDFVVLQANGQTVPGYGTPFDSAANRQQYTELCGWLNDPADDKLWIKFNENWGGELAKICTGARPTFSIAVSRVCPGRSKYLHCAIRLFEEIGCKSWGVDVGENCVVSLEMNGRRYRDDGADLALTICVSVARALRPKCPQCGSEYLHRIHHAPTFALPECDTTACAECDYVSEPS